MEMENTRKENNMGKMVNNLQTLKLGGLELKDLQSFNEASLTKVEMEI